VVRLAPGQSVAAALVALRSLPAVAAADPSRVYSVERQPNDPLVASQYALAQVNAQGAWEYEIGSSSRVTVGIVDAGIQATNAELSGKLTNTASRAFNPNTGAMSLDNPPTQACNHGTRVAGVAAATTDNSSKIAGMSWGAQLLSLKVFLDADCAGDNCSEGTCLTNDAGVAAAIGYATQLQNTPTHGKIVLNLSLGGSGSCAGVVQTAITNAVSSGVVVVISAGNDGGAVNTPANCSGAIPVGATDANNLVTSFSSRGTALSNSGLVAPGSQLLTTDLNDGTANATGTSVSAPMVAGAAALLLSARPTATASEIQAWLRAGADSLGLPSTVQGAGRLNAYKSLRLAVKGTLAGQPGESKPTAFPNPARLSETGTISFALPSSLQGSSPKIRVYTVDGRLVRELTGLVWDGKNEHGNLVASGTYAFVVTTSAGTGRGKVSVLR
jgi:serine protease